MHHETFLPPVVYTAQDLILAIAIAGAIGALVGVVLLGLMLLVGDR